MAQRNRKYAPSEREARFAFRLIFGVFFLLFGVLAVIFTWGSNRLIRLSEDGDDLLAPWKKESDVEFLFKRFPRVTQVLLVISGVILFLGLVWVSLYITTPSIYRDIHASVSALLGVLALVALLVGAAFGWGFLMHNGRMRRAFRYLEGSWRYATLFRDGTTAYYDDKDWKNFTTYSIRIPRGMDWNAERSIRLVEQLIHSFAPLLFRVYADDRAIIWEVVDIHSRESEPIENAIRISYPEADVHIGRPKELTLQFTDPFFRLTLLYRAVNDFIFPLKYATEVKEYDPLTTIASAMNALQPGERIIASVFVAGASRNAHKRGERMLTTSTIMPFDYFSGQGLHRIATLKALELDRAAKFVPRDQQVGEEKLRHPLYQCLFGIQIDSPVKDRILQLAQNIDGQLYGFASAPYNGLRWYTGIKEEREEERVPPDPETLILKIDKPNTLHYGSIIESIILLSEDPFFGDKRKATRLTLGGNELGLLWHLPDKNFVASRIDWLSSRTVPPPTGVIYQPHNYHTTQLGHGTSGGKVFPIHLPLKDRENHVRLIGKTGVGKSSLMYELIMQDIEAGFGVAVIDPHGSLVQSITESKMSDEAKSRIVILDLADKITPPPLNPLRGGLGHVRVGQIVQSIERIYPATSKYPRLSYYLRIALLTLNGDPQATMKDVVRLFTDSSYREALLRQVDSPELHQAWEDFERMKDTERRTIVEPIRTRISPFYNNPDLTPIMCHPDTLDFRELMRQRKILLVSLKMDEERVPETERDLIGALLLSRLQMSGMYQPGNTPYFVYIDEVQRFVTSSLDSMFAEARKFGLSLTVAHQYLEQLPDTAQNAIIGNAGASIVFSCSPKDAQVFQPFVRPHFEVDDIVNLDQFTAVVKMQVDGVSQSAFTLLTPLPPVDLIEDFEDIPVFHRRVSLDPEAKKRNRFVQLRKRRTNAEQLRSLSRATYTPYPREEVNAWLRQRYGYTVKLDDQSQFFETDAPDTASRGVMPGRYEGSGTITADGD